MAKKAAKKAPLPPMRTAKPKLYERVAKPTEVERIEKGKEIAATYLVRRDGMDLEMAKMVVEGMSTDDVNNLIVEFNTATMERVGKTITDAATTPPVLHSCFIHGDHNGEECPECALPQVDFLVVPELASDPEFAQQVLDCAEANRKKLEGEAEYKRLKAIIIPKLIAARKKNVGVGDIGLSVYRGHNVTLNKEKLMEAGVDPLLIAKGYKDTAYNDVRVTVAGVE